MQPVWLGELMRLVDEGRVITDEIDWLLCHFSAKSLRDGLWLPLDERRGSRQYGFLKKCVLHGVVRKERNAHRLCSGV
jgi:hypothetical protein